MFKLALRNVFRQKLRAGMTFASIVVSVAALILSGGFVQDILFQLGEAIIHSQSGHIQVAKTGYFVDGAHAPDKFMISDPDDMRRRIDAVPEVEDVMARLSFTGLLNNGRTDLAIVGEGIEPDREARAGTYVVMKAGRTLGTADRYGILLGEGVAHALGLSPGDRATLLLTTPDGAMNALEFQVVGIFASFSKDYDARTIKITWRAAQELLDTRSANLLVVLLHDTADTSKANEMIRSLLSGGGMTTKRWDELSDFYAKTVELYGRQLGVLRLIVLLMALLGVTNAVNMSIYERTGEIGTLRAMGNRGPFVFTLLATESAILGLLGAAVGVLIGVALAKLISDIGIPMPPPPNSGLGYTAHIRVTPSTVIAAFGIGVVATIVACIPPAFRAARMPIVDALRENA
jgi:putative ABC transport system permease protein